MEKQRIYYLDAVRDVACLMVILMHSPKPGLDTSAQVASATSYLNAPCIGLFFMVSGALLLPVRMPTGDFVRHRLSKVVWPTLFWTAFYLCMGLALGKTSLSDLPRAVLSIPFSAQGTGILWFMYVLIGLYLIAPIISPWLERASKRELQAVLLLWALAMSQSLLKPYLSVAEGYQNALVYFGGYGGYFVLGYYLKNYPPPFRIINTFGVARPTRCLLCSIQECAVEDRHVRRILVSLRLCGEYVRLLVRLADEAPLPRRKVATSRG